MVASQPSILQLLEALRKEPMGQERKPQAREEDAPQTRKPSQAREEDAPQTRKPIVEVPSPVVKTEQPFFDSYVYPKYAPPTFEQGSQATTEVRSQGSQTEDSKEEAVGAIIAVNPPPPLLAPDESLVSAQPSSMSSSSSSSSSTPGASETGASEKEWSYAELNKLNMKGTPHIPGAKTLRQIAKEKRIPLAKRVRDNKERIVNVILQELERRLALKNVPKPPSEPPTTPLRTRRPVTA